VFPQCRQVWVCGRLVPAVAVLERSLQKEQGLLGCRRIERLLPGQGCYTRGGVESVPLVGLAIQAPVNVLACPAHIPSAGPQDGAESAGIGELGTNLECPIEPPNGLPQAALFRVD